MIPGYLEYGGLIFDRIEGSRPTTVCLETEPWSAFICHPGREFDLFVSEPSSQHRLEVIYRRKVNDQGALRTFEPRRIVDWAMQLDPKSQPPCHCSASPVIHRVLEPDLNGQFRKSLWDFHVVNLENRCSDDEHSGPMPAFSPAKFSLIFILSAQDGSSVEIHKSSSVHSNQLDVQWEDLYAEYARIRVLARRPRCSGGHLSNQRLCWLHHVLCIIQMATISTNSSGCHPRPHCSSRKWADQSYYPI